MRKRTYVLLGLISFSAFLIVFLPASALRTVLPDSSGVDLLAPKGTLWHGSARLLLAGQERGELGWRLLGSRLLRGQAAAAWRLASPDADLEGEAAQRFGGSSITVSGTLFARAINRELAPYLIRIESDVELDEVAVAGAPAGNPYGFRFDTLDGLLRWDGGEVDYTLARETNRARLPALVGELTLMDGLPAGTVYERSAYEQGNKIPLIQAQLLATGFVKIGITKRFTDLVDNPWPGDEPEAAIVLEIEEQIL